MNLSQLPNLNALRAFEAAARLESFSQAAQELFVTHGAVGHRIRTLEQELGVALFVRDGKRVALSSAGRTYAQMVRQALQDIARATQAVRSGNRERRLIVSVLPSFAAQWLMPRVGGFIESHPEIEIELMTGAALVDFRNDDVDVGIRLGLGDYPGVVVEKLMAETYFPVCAPNFNQARLPQQPADLLKLPLQRSEHKGWRDWFALAGLPDAPEPAQGALFSDSALALQVMLDGQAIGLVRRSLAQGYLDSGRLLRLFDIELPSREAYFFVCPPAVAQARRVVVFREWLKAQIVVFEANAGLG